MKNFYKTLLNKPRFDFRNIRLKCPLFIVNVFVHIPLPEPVKTKHWWDDYPRVENVQCDNNTILYIPKYQ